jgi:thiol-disulfide isomerase/thioredoxin
LALAAAAVTWTLAGGVTPALAQAPAPQQPGGQPAARPTEQISRDLNEARGELGDAIPDMDALLDPARRATIAGKALPPMRKIVRLLDELGQAEPTSKPQIRRGVMELRAIMAVLGDVESNDYLARLTVSADAGEANAAKGWVLLTRWVTARADAAAQEKVLDEFTGLGRVDPENPMLVQVASLMAESASTPLLGQRVEQIAGQVLAGELAKNLAEELASKRKLASLENQPLVIEGDLLNGQKFSTADWKGKVILVDFWATWCPPCRAELPALKKFYAEHHPKGLEVLGISSDREAADLRRFLEENPDMPWPQLFDAKAGGWHPLAEKFGIRGIPTVFIIDRQGVLRTVQGREKYKELIPKLLEEPVK